jgi:hypothetical protein
MNPRPIVEKIAAVEKQIDPIVGGIERFENSVGKQLKQLKILMVISIIIGLIALLY